MRNKQDEKVAAATYASIAAIVIGLFAIGVTNYVAEIEASEQAEHLEATLAYGLFENFSRRGPSSGVRH
jgi:hypothetical protein